MTSKVARRMQSHADKIGKKVDFKAKMQRIADKNINKKNEKEKIILVFR